MNAATSSTQNSFSISDLQKLGDGRVCRELREEVSWATCLNGERE